MIDVIARVLLLASICALVRRIYIRNFWVSTVAKIVAIPDMPRWDYAFMRVYIEVSYETEKGIIRQKCSFPRYGSSSAGEKSTPPVSWDSALGMYAPVYYKASDPNKVVFIGGARFSDDGFSSHIERFTKGYRMDILLAVPFALGLVILLF